MNSPIILKDFQQRAIEALFNQRHLVLISPTGSGKSLVFQKFIELNQSNARVIFISPLNALARQQASRFESMGLKVWVSAGPSANETSNPDGPGVWVLNPEQLLNRAWKHLKNFRPNLLVVDEAHCIWEWGEGFRPAFKTVLRLLSDFKIDRSLWCTATLPLESLNEIRAVLPSAHVVMGRFSLPQSLQIQRLHLKEPERPHQLAMLLKKHTNESGIIFVQTRTAAERVAKMLRLLNIECVYYHAGLSAEERSALEKKLDRFSKQNPRSHSLVVVATSAFGMGMDYPFLSFCIVLGPSFSLLSLAQAMGRVGRAGVSAHAYVIWHEDDFLKLDWLTHQNPQRLKELNQVKSWCETRDCPRHFMENYFNQSHESGKINERGDFSQ